MKDSEVRTRRTEASLRIYVLRKSVNKLELKRRKILEELKREKEEIDQFLKQISVEYRI